MTDPNRGQLIAAAEALRPLLRELVFVGGSVTGLLITDNAAGDVRGTLDVDAIAEITSYAQYAAFGERLHALGFSEDNREGAPMCRWVHGRTILDVMPLDAAILGFSNRWYKAAMESSETRTLSAGLEIRMITAPFFVGTKLEAFKGRGKEDFLESHDLEDFVSVVDGRESLLTEVRAERSDLIVYIQHEVKRLVTSRAFTDSLPGYLRPDSASQSRIGIVLERLKALASG